MEPIWYLKESLSLGYNVLVEFTEEVEKTQTRFENGMKAYIKHISEEDEDGFVKMTFDEREFKEVNVGLEKPYWFNPETKEYDLKWSEDEERTSNYEKELSISYYVEDDIEDFVIIAETNKKGEKR